MDLRPRPCSICGELRPVSRLSRPIITCQPCRSGTPRVPREARTYELTPAKAMRCASCSGAMWRSITSLPEGQARCLPCRRKARGLGPNELFKEALKTGRLRQPRGDCARCKGPIPTDSRRVKYCGDECFRKARNSRGSGAKKDTRARGYGKEHVALRKKLLPLAYGTPCHLCGEVMAEGERLHLDHTEDRTGYRGMTHDFCNVREGARRGGQRARQARLERGWRPGQDPRLRRKTRIGA